MSEEKETSGQPDQTASGSHTGDKVAYETYRKTVEEAKRAKAEREELKAKLEELEKQKLEETGQVKELAERLKRENAELQLKFKNSAKQFGKTILEREVKSVASQYGVRPEALEDLVKIGSFKDIPLNEDFTVDTEKVKETLSGMKKEKPYLFIESKSAPRDVSPQGSGASIGSVDLSKMSKEELIKWAMQNNIK